jgi:hypothetical protein
MGVDLRNATGEEFYINNSGWRYLIEFAQAHGFRWPTAQDGDEDEALTAAEASELANAIDRGIGDGPPDDVARRVAEELTKLLVTPSKSPIFPQNPIAISAKTIDYWREFTRFARRGGFSIQF